MTSPATTPPAPTPAVTRDELAGPLRDAGWHLLGGLPSATAGGRWSARDAEGRRGVVSVVPPRPPAGARHLEHRVGALVQIEHAHLPRTRDLVHLPRGRLVVVQEEVVGTDLATLARARGPWAPGEVVTVLVPVAGALAALHAAGLSHGDVSPANIVLGATGRAVLVDLLCGDDPLEQGTPAVAAPERPRGATPGGDVYAAARTGLRLLGGDDARSDAGRAAVVTCLRGATAADPAARPTAAELAASLFAACPPVPVELPEPSVLARVELRRFADGSAADRTQRAAAPAPRGRHRARRRRPWLVASCTALLLAVAGVALMPPVRTALAAAAAPDAPPVATVGVAAPTAPRDAGASAAAEDPVAAAARLTAARARALVGDDPVALRRVTVAGSPAALADAASWQRLRSAGVRPDDVDVEVSGVRRLPPGPATYWCHCVLVELTARVSAVTPTAVGDPARSSPGTPVADTVEGRTVVLVLRPGDDGWRVSEVRPPDR